ncbi:hypothetical protein DSO57_1002824 [Entomophthora muscae]|uniref:Uncharacterized protein n=2 Tax=Entomophthora muscae TaxID=34485 RepID=A0ACC2RZR1_9FUNG|nr:hypothetical protein DSO57_1035378 [Entomophthora muscae]KAJ9055528.1 hypothetical protein DSO57_1002824 [Entomophthora muscae]
MSSLSRYSRNFQYRRFTPETVLRWSPALARWGLVSGIGVLYFMEGIPLVRQDVLSKIPLFGNFWSEYAQKPE